mmetsp:Transcript_21180/g.51840  ORF Transcript_21180/g.51840 Transcript_21180/m.51840 type:complete len:295 (+) Transcript_21180:3-887(+)
MKREPIPDRDPDDGAEAKSDEPPLANGQAVYKDIEGAEVSTGAYVSAGVLCVVVFLASLVELISAGKLCHDENKCADEFAWAVCVGAISLTISLAHLIIIRFLKGKREAVEVWIAMSLAILWLVGIAVLTFDSPFQATGNGYFSCWLAFIAASMFLYITSATLRDFIKENFKQITPNSSAILVLLVASAMEVTASSIFCHKHTCYSEIAFGVSVGVISSATCLVHLFLPQLAPYVLYTSAVVTFLWIVAAGILTFNKPFTTPGNGYFSAWISMFASCTWFYLSLMNAGLPVGDL